MYGEPSSTFFLLFSCNRLWAWGQEGHSIIGEIADLNLSALTAGQLTIAWATDDFLQSQILQALGQSFALTALVFLIVQSINPGDTLTIGALPQRSRPFGGEIGTAFMQTFVR